MKKSFFKRAAATISVVPLALTQCLTFSYAVDDSSAVQAAQSADSTTLSVDSLLYIEPTSEETSDGVQTSTWNLAVRNLLLNAADEGKGAVEIDPTSALTILKNYATGYAEEVDQIFSSVKDTKAEIVAGENVLKITGSIEGLDAIIAEQAQGRINEELEKVKAEYPEVSSETFGSLTNVDFSGLGDISGTIEVTIDWNSLDSSTKLPVSYTITTSDGTEYTLTGDNSIFDYISEKYGIAKQAVLDAANEVFADVKAEFDDAEQQAADAQVQFDEAQVKLDDAQVKLDDAQAKLDDAQTKLADAEAKLADAKAKLDEAQAKLDEATALGGDTTAEQADLDEKKAEYDSKSAEYTEKKAEFDEKSAELADKQAEFESKKAEYNEKKAEFEEKKAELAQAEMDFDAAGADALSKIDDVFADYDSQLKKAQDAVEKYATPKSFDTKSFSTAAELITAIENSKAGDKAEKFGDLSSATAYLTSGNNSAMFNEVIANVKTLMGGAASVELTPETVGAWADSLYDITVEGEDGVYTFEAKFADTTAEQNAVIAYYDSVKNKTVTDTWKEITITVDSNLAASSTGSVQIDLIRRIISEDKDVTTTTTTVTTTTDVNATTTTTTNDVDVTTTTTNDVDVTTTTTTNDVDVTTTTTTNDVDVTTTTTTNDVDVTTTTTTNDVDVTTTTTTNDVDVTTTTTTNDVDVTTTTTTNDVDVTTTTTTTVVNSYVSLETVPGYYFSHDTRTFDKGQVVQAIYYVVYSDGTDETVVDTDITADVDFNGATPANTYVYTEGSSFSENFIYDVPVYYNGEALTLEDGSDAVITAYIGVKGDVDLNGVADGVDSSFILQYYAQIQTGATPEETPVVEKNSFTDPELENLVAFLGDVSVDEKSEDNFKTAKTEENRVNETRRLDGVDSSFVLQFYAESQTSSDKSTYEIWADVVTVGLLIDVDAE
jgi:hypothetical protein